MQGSDILLGTVVGYFIGSIPFAYLLTHRMTGLDLRSEGSRNIGTMNAFEVTKSKRVGIVVLAADVLKGAIPVVVFALLGMPIALHALLPALLIGHCYPVWLKFHGGRGLATAAGALLPLNPLLVVAWLLFYWLGRKLYDHVHFGATFSLLVCLLLLSIAPISAFEATTFSYSGMSEMADLFILSVMMMVVVMLSRHIQPALELWRSGRK